MTAPVRDDVSVPAADAARGACAASGCPACAGGCRLFGVTPPASATAPMPGRGWLTVVFGVPVVVLFLGAWALPPAAAIAAWFGSLALVAVGCRQG